MAEEGAVRVTTSEEGPVVRRLEIEVDPKRVRRAFDRAYRDLAKRARVKGFRAGKAPRGVLEKMFGPQVREEIERLLVSESLPEAVEEAGVRPVAEPSIDAQAPEEDAPFRYTAEIEVKPTIALPTLEGLPARTCASAMPSSWKRKRAPRRPRAACSRSTSSAASTASPSKVAPGRMWSWRSAAIVSSPASKISSRDPARGRTARSA
jgi:hypothetical protein